MSRLHKAVLGLPQGTLGSIVFRIKRGVAFMSTRPISFMPGIQPADYARRGRFGLTCKFSKLVNSIPQLKTLWTPAVKGASAYNLIAKNNYPYISDTEISAAAVITPEGGLGLTVNSAAVTSLELQVDIAALLTDRIDPAVETKVRLLSILDNSVPVDVNQPAHSFLPFVSDAIALDVQAPMVFNIAFDTQDTVIYNQYTAHKLFYAIVTEDNDGKVYHYSRTGSV